MYRPPPSIGSKSCLWVVGWMFRVEVYLRVRRAVMVEGRSVREASRVFGLHRDTVRKMLAYSVPPGVQRQLLLPAHWLTQSVTHNKWLPQVTCYRKSGSLPRGRRHRQDGEAGIAGDDPRPVPRVVQERERPDSRRVHGSGHHRKYGIRLLAQTGYDAGKSPVVKGPIHLRRGGPRGGDRDLGGCRPDLRQTAEGGAAQPGGVHGATWASGSGSPGASAAAGGQRVHPGPSAQTHQSHCGQPP